MNTFDLIFSKDANYNLPIEHRRDNAGRYYEEYLPSDSLVEAVQLAIDLQLPLLLEGEPGCGKTQLASAIVYQLTQQNRRNGSLAAEEWWPYHIWTVKSYTRARDGLYTFDAIGRLRDAQMVGMLSASEILKIKDPKTYRTFGSLGKALYDEVTQQAPDKRAVVLIDEVDKADSDFTNDLLLELDEFRFEVVETGEKIEPPPEPPIIILTSNREKPLPDAFLRRCLYFKIEFPAKDKLREIAEKRLKNLAITQDQDLVDQIITKFIEVRDDLQQPGSRPPGTSEFLAFVTALDRKLRQATDVNVILNELDLPGALPLLGILLKTEDDQKLYAAKAGKRRSAGGMNE